MRNQEIERLIRSLGIGATYRGYRYLSYGVEVCLSDDKQQCGTGYTHSR